MDKQIIVTSYNNPDLDGTACAYGYAEFLEKQGKHATAAVSGMPHREAQFVLRTFSIPLLADADALFSQDVSIILVDASDVGGLSRKLDPQQVVEIVDHRKINQADKFPNAKVQIELVGSAATLIAEKFFKENVPISQQAAVLLYSAIVSNTVNFQANVTTERDRKIADWLLTKLQLPENYIHMMFADKSKFEAPLREVFEHDIATFTFGGKHIVIVQLEIVTVQEFIQKNEQEIVRILGEMKHEKNLDYIFLTAIDLEKATNTFFVIDDATKALLEKILLVSFHYNIAQRKGIMMRKTITPLLKQALE